jgi:hypothetical protein
VKRFGSVHSPVDAVDKNVLFLEIWTYPQLWIIFGGIFDFLPQKLASSLACCRTRLILRLGEKHFTHASRRNCGSTKGSTRTLNKRLDPFIHRNQKTNKDLSMDDLGAWSYQNTSTVSLGASFNKTGRDRLTNFVLVTISQKFHIRRPDV